MIKYVVKRLLILIPTLLAVIFIVFFITSLTPGRSRITDSGSECQQRRHCKEKRRVGVL